ncbi:MAG: efflux RND transporter periplasmic adaptor subunit [Candidatus Jidaibacter sp.]|jgi:HlyD family secretion protein|nr:efflux RND transporter periplasmic adaptor subunit [Candidatus Jidaibacter sp.]
MKISDIFIKNWKLPVIALVGICFALYSVISLRSADKHEISISPPIAPYQNAIAGIGIVEPKSEIISISTELAGVLREMHVKVGDSVKKGDPLFSLDQRDVDAQIAILNASLEVANAQLLDAAAQFEIVKSMDDRRAVAKEDFYKRKYAEQIAAAKIQEIQAQLNQAHTTKERMTVLSPITGEILEVNIRPGEYASTGNLSAPLIVMGDMQTLNLRVEIDEENAGKINANSEAKGMLRGDPDNDLNLKFIRFEEYIRGKQNLAVAGQRVDTRVIRVIYEIQNPNKKIRAGQQMDVYIAQ